eukprot:4516953-Pleurochrysis_carterae.AAC.1
MSPLAACGYAVPRHARTRVQSSVAAAPFAVRVAGTTLVAGGEEPEDGVAQSNDVKEEAQQLHCAFFVAQHELHMAPTTKSKARLAKEKAEAEARAKAEAERQAIAEAEAASRAKLAAEVAAREAEERARREAEEAARRAIIEEQQRKEAARRVHIRIKASGTAYDYSLHPNTKFSQLHELHKTRSGYPELTYLHSGKVSLLDPKDSEVNGVDSVLMFGFIRIGFPPLPNYRFCTRACTRTDTDSHPPFRTEANE